MRWQTVKQNILNGIFTGYLKLIENTCRIRFENRESISFGHIVGFWHGDSFLMNLVLKEFSAGDADISIIVTADERGDYIEHQIGRFGARTLRMPDGFRMKPFLKELMEESRKQGEIMAVSLDGPLGPLHEPKKLAFLLAQEGQKNFIGIRIHASRAIRLTKRWDQYAIPLPFTEITVTLKDFGMVTREDLKQFKSYREKITEGMLETDETIKDEAFHTGCGMAMQNVKSMI